MLDTVKLMGSVPTVTAEALVTEKFRLNCPGFHAVYSTYIGQLSPGAKVVFEQKYASIARGVAFAATGGRVFVMDKYSTGSAPSVSGVLLVLTIANPLVPVIAFGYAESCA